MDKSKSSSNVTTSSITGVATQKVRSVSRRATPYKGGDVLMDWHRAKAKGSMSEAYRDADYATPIWKCHSDWDDFVKFVKDLAITLPFLALFTYICYEILVAMGVLVIRL